MAFDTSNQAIDFRAEADTEFVLGSAASHPHDLVLGYYSVHTSPAALQAGEQRIAEIQDAAACRKEFCKAPIQRSRAAIHSGT